MWTAVLDFAENCVFDLNEVELYSSLRVVQIWHSYHIRTNKMGHFEFCANLAKGSRPEKAIHLHSTKPEGLIPKRSKLDL